MGSLRQPPHPVVGIGCRHCENPCWRRLGRHPANAQKQAETSRQSANQWKGSGGRPPTIHTTVPQSPLLLDCRHGFRERASVVELDSWFHGGSRSETRRTASSSVLCFRSGARRALSITRVSRICRSTARCLEARSNGSSRLIVVRMLPAVRENRGVAVPGSPDSLAIPCDHLAIGVERS